MEIKGIDISHWNGEIDFNKVKQSGIDFVIIKAGGSDKGFYVDPKFRDDYKKAKEAGLEIGAYYFAGKNFLGALSGILDARRFIDILSGMEFSYPVFVDIETTDKRYKDMATDAAAAFCSTMEAAGYFGGVYASDISGFKERLNKDRLEDYTSWVARYGAEPSYIEDWAIWQHSSKGSIPGVSGSVDLDISRKDFAKVIKSKGLNNYKAENKKRKKAQKEV